MAGPAPLPLALTMGEPAGIGGEIALAAWRRRGEEALPAFFLLDDPKRLAALSRRLGASVPIRMPSSKPSSTRSEIWSDRCTSRRTRGCRSR